jgi:cobalt-zinc-cadmium efflux system protein
VSAGHSHSGGHGHDHAGGTAGNRRRLAIVLALTASVLVVEVVGALVSGSLALLADATHAFVDSAGLVIALVAATLALRPATAKRTWGYRRAEVLGATLQAAVLLAVGVYVVIEAIRRLFAPAEVAAGPVLVFGIVGLIANTIGILVLIRGSGHGGNVNMRAALLEVVNDTLGSLAVIISAVVIALTGWERADAVASLVIAALIVPRTLKLLREMVSLLLESTPPRMDLDEVRAHMLALPHVLAVSALVSSSVASRRRYSSSSMSPRAYRSASSCRGDGGVTGRSGCRATRTRSSPPRTSRPTNKIVLRVMPNQPQPLM